MTDEQTTDLSKFSILIGVAAEATGYVTRGTATDDRVYIDDPQEETS